MYHKFSKIPHKQDPKKSPHLFLGMGMVFIAFAMRQAGLDAFLYIFLVGGLGIGLYGIYLNRQARSKAWRQLASRIGIKMENHPINGPSISGTYRGHALKVFTGTTGTVAGSSGVSHTYINVSNPGLPPQERVVLQLIKAPHNTDNRSVSELFKESFDVQGSPNNQLAQALTKEDIQSALLDLAMQHKRLSITFKGQGVSIEESVNLTDIAYMQSLIDLLVDLQGFSG